MDNGNLIWDEMEKEFGVLIRFDGGTAAGWKMSVQRVERIGTESMDWIPAMEYCS